jgi:hypothetical protein
MAPVPRAEEDRKVAHDDIKTPRPGPDSEIPGERRPADEITGSQTGTIGGGGGREGHNPSAVRGTGADDDAVGSASVGSEGEFEDEELEDEAFDDPDGDSDEFKDED